MQKRRDVGFTYGCSSTRRIRHMISNIFACFLSPAKLLETFPLQFCPRSVSWRHNMKLARAWGIIFPKVTVTLPEAASSLMEKGGEGLGVNHSHLHQSSIPTGRCGLISIVILSVWRFIIRLDCWPDPVQVPWLWSSLSLLPLRLGQSPHQPPHTQGCDLKITPF